MYYLAVAITKSAKKAHAQSLRRRVFNIRRIRAMKEETKDFEKLIVSGDKAGAAKELAAAYQAIDKAAKRGVIKKNTAARRKARLARLLAK